MRLPWGLVGLWVGCLSASSHAEEAFNMTRVGHLPLAPVTDVAAAGALAFVAGAQTGVTIVDLADPTQPALLATWTHPDQAVNVVDVRAVANHLYLANEAGDQGLLILDASQPAAPVLAAALGPSAGFPSLVHNIAVQENLAFLAGYGDAGGNVILNTQMPAAPTILATIPVGIHDLHADGDQLQISGGWEGFWIYDIRDPAQPAELTHFIPANPDTHYYSHNSRTLPGTPYILQGEEVTRLAAGGGFMQGGLRIIDRSNPQAPVTRVRWQTEASLDNPAITCHNAWVVGELAYVSYYQEGIRVLDLADPLEPVEVGWYDTFPEPAVSLFEGCWGVDASQAPDRILASDRTHGLYVLRHNGARRTTLTGVVRDGVSGEPLAAAVVRSITAQRRVTTGAGGGYTLRTGAGDHLLEVAAEGYMTRTAWAWLEDFATHTLDLELYPYAISVSQTNPPSSPILLLEVPKPHPVRGEASIAFALARAVPAELAIFNSLGRRLATLGRQRLSAGRHTRRWHTAGMPAGVYWVRLSAGGETVTQKITLAR